jgi:alkylhydroperoxidase family enzyme
MTKERFEAHGPLPVRQDLADAIERAWRRLAGPGTWWNGAQRLRMVAETRNALQCPLCRRRKAALSPYTVEGAHHSLGTLPDAVVEVIHRVRTDAGRLTETWLNATLASGLTDAEYVEIVGIVATTAALDTFNLAMGLPPAELPAAIPGEPSRRRPKGARKQIAWVPTVAPDDMTPDDVNPYPEFGAVHIQQALSLVPETVIQFFDLDVALYLRQEWIRDFSREYRALSHTQLELIAAKASVMNGCYY